MILSRKSSFASIVSKFGRAILRRNAFALFAVLCFGLSALAQLPDAPSTTKATTCTEKNGDPCPEWVHKIIGQYPPVNESEACDGKPDHFLTIGNGRRWLHPDKKSYGIFMAAHAGMWAATVLAVHRSRTSHEDSGSELPVAAFLTGIDFLVFRTYSPAMSIGPVAYATVHYSLAAAR